MKHPLTGIIRNNRWLTPNVFELVVSVPDNELSIKPGQFVELTCHGYNPVFLNRPFSPFYVYDQDLHFLIQQKGKGTSNLANLNQGDKITMLAPLGKPFPTPSPTGKILLIAGGVGLAPVYFYLSTYLKLHSKLSITLVYGTTQEEDKVELPSFLNSVQYFYHADQSDSQTKSNLYIFFQKLPTLDFDQVIICGPLPMMRAFSKHFSKEKKLHYVSLETMMACGLGLCKGCSISTSMGMKSVCSDGPVFDGSQLDWNLL